MKAFFEDLGKRLGETAETVTNKAGEAMEIQKLKSQIRTLERGNDTDFIDLGHIIYQRFLGGEAVSEEAVGLCEAIQSRKESIAEYEQKISDVKGDFQCQECGKTVAKGMAYCPYCGTKAAEKAADFAEETAENAADFAEETAEKAEDIVEEAVEKAEDVAETVAEHVAEAAEAVKEKVEETTEE